MSAKESFVSLARIKPASRTGAANAGWAYDAYPDLPQLRAGERMVVAEIAGPAVITTLHFTQNIQASTEIPSDIRAFRKRMEEQGPPGADDKDSPATPLMVTVPADVAARGVVLEIYYDGAAAPAVQAPLADFFADGCNGKAAYFTTPFVEKAPKSYNCFIPMPFKGSAKVVLRNDTTYNMQNYSFVEWESLPEWDESLGYFHATWRRERVRLDHRTRRKLLNVKGPGHLIGRACSIETADPRYERFGYVMEGNVELRIDGESEPRINYLGTEDSFNFSWGFQAPFLGIYNGINYVQPSGPSQLSIYRFHNNPIRFSTGLDIQLSHQDEWVFHVLFKKDFEGLPQDRLWVDYAETFYWYQQQPGFAHAPMPDLDARLATVA